MEMCEVRAQVKDSAQAEPGQHGETVRVQLVQRVGPQQRAPAHEAAARSRVTAQITQVQHAA
jgi:hypothetical protein